MVEIKLYENNYLQGAEEVTARLEKDGVSFEVESCLGYCGDCAIDPFVLVDDELFR